MKKILRILLISILILFVLMQFYPRKNDNLSPEPSPSDISFAHAMPTPIKSILKTSCYDCHSNRTVYPWYANIQPFSLWLSNHVDDGKKDLNFSEFKAYPLRRQYRKLEEINELVKEGEMPLPSYTWIHRDAILSAEQKAQLASWVVALRDSMKAVYPTDSLVRKR